MNTAGPSAAHLTQEKLSDKDKEILAGLQDWVSHADFEPKSKICIDKSLGEKRPLIYGLDVMKKVSPTLRSYKVVSADQGLVCAANIPD